MNPEQDVRWQAVRSCLSTWTTGRQHLSPASSIPIRDQREDIAPADRKIINPLPR